MNYSVLLYEVGCVASVGGRRGGGWGAGILLFVSGYIYVIGYFLLQNFVIIVASLYFFLVNS